jgi:homopolymeric O-antigen transport system ATP-binding protein
MPDTVIKVDNLSKRYLVGHQTARAGPTPTMREMLTREARNFARKAVDLIRGRQIVQGDEVEEFWALRNVTFEVKQGEILGIIGRNGAGKSTLFKVLSHITEPTEGRVEIRGRVASLLEVGTGFHQELTGRENIFLNGAILGKRFSSGMYVRLAFAIAAHLEPDILIVDEVLAVGDSEFQKKCLGKMDDVSRREGRTVLFVSHTMGIVNSLCSSAMWLDQGKIRRIGPTKEIIDEYAVKAHPPTDRIVSLESLPRPHYIQDERVRLKTLEWLSGLPLRTGDPVTARITFEAKSSIQDFSIGIGFS